MAGGKKPVKTLLIRMDHQAVRLINSMEKFKKLVDEGPLWLAGTPTFFCAFKPRLHNALETCKEI